MPPTPVADNYDVIVIGAGMGGLVCAAKLQKNGKKVLLLEQHHKVGGYCTNFKRRGYEFEAAIHFIAGCEPGGPLHDILKECGAENYVGFIKLDPVYKGVFPDRTINFPPEIEPLKKMLKDMFPDQAKNIDRYFEDFNHCYDCASLMTYKRYTWLDRLLCPFTHYKGLRFIIRHFNSTYAEYLDKTITDPRLREILSQLWAFVGLPPKQCSLLFFLMAYMIYYREGAYYIDGGSQKLSDAIARAFQENGGTLMTQTDVREIIVTGKTAQGVMVEDKRTGEVLRVTADKIVSGADAGHTYLDLVGRRHLPSRFVRRLEAMKPAVSAFVVYLGVDMELPEAYKDDADIFVNHAYDSAKGFYRTLNRESYEEIALTIYTNLCPQFSPEPGKKHVITALVLMDLDEPNMKKLWGTDDVQQRGDAYRRIKQEIAEKILDRAEDFFPHIRKKIEVMEIGTPITMKRYTRNRNGSMVGWENTPPQSVFRRLGQKGPLRNLFLASAWTFPGGGVNGATMGGSLAADRVLNKLVIP